MKRLWLFLSSAVLGVFFCAYAEDVTPGIYMSPERSLLAVHEDGSWEVYSNWADLPDNRISLGYMSERSACADEDREAAASSPGTDGIHAVWKGMTFSPVDSCPLFPTANEFAVSGMVWENDQLGTLRFSEDGTVRSDDSESGSYDLGLLRLAGRAFYVQCVPYGVDPGEEDPQETVLTLYEVSGDEVIGRLLLVGSRMTGRDPVPD